MDQFGNAKFGNLDMKSMDFIPLLKKKSAGIMKPFISKARQRKTKEINVSLN